MRVSLSPYPALPAPALAVDVEILASAGVLTLRYAVTGEAGGVLWPAPAATKRADELWRHTCFEAFVRTPGEDGYLELNFAPSTLWAAYRFDAYRAGMRDADLAPRVARTGDGVEAVLTLPFETPWRMGATAVIEETDGRISYWALAHAPDKPDFHHPDSFAYVVP